MKLIFLGTGSAFTVGTDNFHSNMLLISDTQEKLMIDCGSDARLSLFQQKMSHLDISNVYISHLHADHAGGLEWLALTTKFDPRCTKKPNLFICEALVNDLWNKTLSGGLSTIQCEFAKLSTFFDLHPINVNGSFTWENTEFRIVQTVHVMNGFSLMYSFGLFTVIDGLRVFITTDTQFAPKQMTDFLRISDIIFHDCETAAFPSGVHAHYTELLTLPDDLRKKMWLYHYNPGPLPDAVKDGFCGFIVPGQTFDFKDHETLFPKKP